MLIPSYQSFVESRARANPCISRLSDYLQHECLGESKITYLDYTTTASAPERIDVPENKLSQLIKTAPSGSTRFVFVENISPGIIISLGEKLDIDPLFFADYIHVGFENLEKLSPLPSLATLPSVIATRDHIHLHCQKVIALEGTDEELKHVPYALKTESNVPRNVRRLVTLPGGRLALTSMMENIVHYLRVSPPPGLDFKSPSIIGIGYYPIYITLSEWDIYTYLTSRCSTYYEYSDQVKTGRMHDEVECMMRSWLICSGGGGAVRAATKS
ncbi:hypothetical protein FVEG_12708 [Fusarium verticillioides 7600]|uniref:Uncharacterized protein n=1 Tax=Gibberella moniliformis (strain M3125 / FGSC 7600) TaxID=334819 RepID=W7MSR6_GIBM7|nr:hypothetical protein FVEG_12708 [Fusarium verticillioides 7600]EWG54498.1 hypothetical protein FVEG_12708 [Fusarium verticillioides 7600]